MTLMMRWWLLLCVIGLTLKVGSASSLPAEEISALLDLFHSCGSDEWSWDREGNVWRDDEDFSLLDPCEEHWQGVECSCLFSDYVHDFAYNYYYYSPAPTFDNTTCTVIGLNLPLFNLQGTLPSSLQNLANLTFLHLPGNSLRGAVFDVIFPAMHNLVILGLANNFFTGTIPEGIDQLSSLSRIILRENSFSGSLPASLANLDVQGFDTNTNHFTGTVPPEIFSVWKRIVYFDIAYNEHRGPLNFLFDFPITYMVRLHTNFFTGPLPDLTACEHLNVINIGSNHFTGHIPFDEWAEKLPYLKSISARDTKCSGTIPASISKLVDLRLLDLTNTLLHGSIPPELGRLTEMRYLYLGKTMLSSTIPDSVGNLKELLLLTLCKTHVSGTLPGAIGNWTRLATMELYMSLFTGTIPEEIKYLQSLTTLSLQNNAFSGEIPFSIFSHPSIDIVQLQHNNFDRIASPGNTSASQSLRIVDLSTNMIRGSLHPELFVNASRVEIFAAVRNCFTHYNLQKVCEAKQLKIFSMDGIHGACPEEPWIHASTLPSCLMNLPQLHFLHMAEVHLTGSIPTQITATLTDLSLAHNSLTGSIPTCIQENNWESIDLSFNKLNGVLLGNNSIANDTITRLHVNRLSGSIPSNLREVSKISLLDGNIFECEFITRRSLPNNDPDNDIYSCGTNSLNVLLYVWYICFVLTLVYMLYKAALCQSLGELMESVRELIWAKLELSAKDSNNEIKVFRYYLQRMKRVFVFSAVLAAAMLLPVYLVLSNFWKTYEYSYAFQVSSIYMSGIPAAVVLAVLWLGLAVFTNLYSHYLCKYCLQPLQSAALIGKHEATTFRMLFKDHRMLSCKFVALNVVVFGVVTAYIVAVNIGFIYSQISYGPAIAVYCQVALAAIKLITNQIIIPLLIKIVFHEARVKKLHESRRAQLQWFRRLQLRIEVFLAIVSNIIAPCIAAAVSSSSCYYYAIFPPEQITTKYIMENCSFFLVYFELDIVQCLRKGFEELVTVYTPSFEYGYHCSSFLINNYSSVYVYMYLLNSFIKPVVREYLGYAIHAYKNSKTKKVQPRVINVVPGSASGAEENKTLEKPKPAPMVLNKDDFVLQFVGSTSILLTFGVMYPPLFFIISYFMIVSLGETEDSVAESVVEEKLSPMQLVAMRRDIISLFRDTNENMQWQVVPVMVGFCAYFLADIIGDSHGWQAALALGLSFAGSYTIICYLTQCREAKAVTPTGDMVLPVAHSNGDVAHNADTAAGLDDTAMLQAQQFLALDTLDDADEQEETMYDLIATFIGAFFVV